VLNQASPIEQKRLLCQQKQVKTVGFRNALLEGSRLKNVTVSSQSLGGHRRTTVTIVILSNKNQCKAQPLSDGREWGSILRASGRYVYGRGSANLRTSFDRQPTGWHCSVRTGMYFS